MANGAKSIANVGLGQLGGLAEKLKLKGKGSQDVQEFELMRAYTEKHDLPVDNSMTLMALLSTVSISTLADAYESTNVAGAMGGSIKLDNGRKFDPTGARRDPDAHGTRLHREIEAMMDNTDMPSDKRKELFGLLERDNAEVAFGVGHAFFELGAMEKSNIQDAARLRRMIETANIDWRDLPTVERKPYMEIVNAGREAARSKWAGQSLAGIIAMLNDGKSREAREMTDTADTIIDPKNPNRTAEFDGITRIKNAKPDATITEFRDVAIKNDIEEFVTNCLKSELITDDAKDPLVQKMTIVAQNETSVTEALQKIEQIKYAIFVGSMSEGHPLDSQNIELLAGQNTYNAANILNTVASYLARVNISLPRGFQSIGSLGDISALLKEPLLGGGPTLSFGASAGLPKLQKCTEDYSRELGKLRDTTSRAKAMRARFSSLIGQPNSPFTSNDVMDEFIKRLLDDGNFQARLNHAEAHLSQRMANGIARSMKLTANATPGRGFGVDEGILAISPIEEGNLVREFDLLFRELIQEPTGMWQHVETMDALNAMTLDQIKAAPTKEEPERMKLVNAARNMGIAYVMMKERGGVDEDVLERIKCNAGEKVKTALNKIINQRQLDLKDESTRPGKKLIAAQESYHLGKPDLTGILGLMNLIDEKTDKEIFPYMEDFPLAPVDITPDDKKSTKEEPKTTADDKRSQPYIDSPTPEEYRREVASGASQIKADDKEPFGNFSKNGTTAEDKGSKPAGGEVKAEDKGSK